MSKINLYSDKQTSATSVSNIFIDEYMSDANGEFVKIYLFLLRHLSNAGANFTLSEIADRFEHTEKDVKRALCYWERMQLLHLDYDKEENLIGIQLKEAPAKESATETGSAVLTDVHTEATASLETDGKPGSPADYSSDTGTDASIQAPKISFSPDEMKQFMEQEAVAELLFIAEQYLGRTLTITDLNAIFYWYDGLKLSIDLIEYLIEYCVSKGHSSIRYIEKVALSWAQNQYQTVEQAKLASGQYNQAYNAVMKALGISGRSLVSSETAYIDNWRTNYGFSIEMIQLACNKTIQTIHEPSFEYTDRILSNWKAGGITTPDAVASADSEHQKKKKASAAASSAARSSGKNKFANFEQRTYDYEELEKMLLTTKVK